MAKPAARPVANLEKPARGHLLRVLGVGFGLAVTLGNTIGAGILRTPGEVAAHLPNRLLFVSVWVAGGLFAFLCAVSIAELAVLIPRSGGHYVFARYTFGDYAGFIVGWSDWLSTCGSTAAVAIIIGEYTGLLVPALSGQGRRTAILVVVAFALLHWRGVRWGSGVQQVTSLLKAAAFLGLVVACFAFAGPQASSTVSLHLPAGLALLVAIALSLQAVVYTYDGWQGVIYFSEEVHDPPRDIPRSMFGGVFSVILIYVLLNLAVLHVLPMAQVAGSPLPLARAAGVMWGQHADTVLQVVVIVSMLSAINAYQMMACRILFAMSRDRLFWHVADRVNPRGTPTLALFLSSAISILFIASGTFDKVIAVLAFFFVFNYIVGLLAVFALRRREPDRPRSYRAWGYPWTTALAVCASLGFFCGVILGDTRTSIYSVLVLAASYPAFRLIKLHHQRRPAE